jgi:uncharacterized membrane protein
MATRAEVIATARWQARQHMDGDLLTVAQWHECLARAWRRLWNLHPEAFHVDGELVGERPELPDVADAAAVLPISDEWLDVLGAASGLGAAQHWAQIGVGIAFALAASATFGLAMVITQHETAEVDGRLRSFTTMATVAVLAAVVASSQSGFHLPHASAGWWGLGALTFLYGTAFTIMFTVLPKMGVVGNSAIMNVEPIFALVLAWALLGQAISPMQLMGAAVVVATVMWLGLRKP